MMAKTIWGTIAFIVGVVVFVGGMVWYGQKQEGEPTGLSATQKEVLLVGPSDWAKGSANAPITIIEYSDFQCPACAAYYPTLKRLEREFPEQIRIIYRYFPLSEIHPHAFIASQVAEAAGRQGKFWEMHDLLFEKQKLWSDKKDPLPDFMEYGKSLGLNEDLLKKDLSDPTLLEKIRQQRLKGEKLSIGQTPTFFLNEKKIDPNGFDGFKKLIEDELALAAQKSK